MKVVVWLDNAIRAFSAQPEQVAALRARYPQHTLVVVHEQEAFLQELRDAEVALAWRFSADWYARAPALRCVATPAAGREWLEPDATGRVRVVHGAFHGKIMAETLLATMLFHSRRLAECLQDQRERRYDREAYSTTRRLSGQRALILGYGALGRECAKLLKTMGMHVVGVKRSAAVAAAPADEVRPVTELLQLLPFTEHVIITLPGDTGTQHLFSDAAFEALPRGASLYSLGRGSTLDEAALLRALGSGRLGYAFLDVFEREPLPADSPLWTAPNLLLMPHASAICREYLELWFEELESTLFGSNATAVAARSQ